MWLQEAGYRVVWYGLTVYRNYYRSKTQKSANYFWPCVPIMEKKYFILYMKKPKIQSHWLRFRSNSYRITYLADLILNIPPVTWTLTDLVAHWGYKQQEKKKQIHFYEFTRRKFVKNFKSLTNQHFRWHLPPNTAESEKEQNEHEFSREWSQE